VLMATPPKKATSTMIAKMTTASHTRGFLYSTAILSF
jgi:hypothetical protein